MPILDFSEIPSAKADNNQPGLQDTFELFARDFLEMLGYSIISPPNRGPDLGKDIIIEEIRRGIGGETKIKWLVSCKHYAHSGQSITTQIEANILDRVKSNHCNGFIGFYSTLASSGLLNIVEGLNEIEHQIFDNERIEKYILGSSKNLIIAKRYFPESIKRWESTNPKPADILINIPDLVCNYTGENLLQPEPKGIIALGFNKDIEKGKIYEDIYWCVKGEPDRILEQRFYKRDLLTEWEDIPDIVLPTVYIRWCISPLNQLRSGIIYTDIAFEKYKEFIISLFPYVARHMTETEKQRAKKALEIQYMFGRI